MIAAENLSHEKFPRDRNVKPSIEDVRFVARGLMVHHDELPEELRAFVDQPDFIDRYALDVMYHAEKEGIGFVESVKKTFDDLKQSTVS